MIAIDTNVLVRLLTNDDPVQSPRAAAVFAREDVHIPKTVLLETEWVLRGAYGLAPTTIQAAFERLRSTRSVTLEDPTGVQQALAWYTAGMDFADALHLASAGQANRFVTFDGVLVKRAKRLGGLVDVERL